MSLWGGQENSKSFPQLFVLGGGGVIMYSPIYFSMDSPIDGLTDIYTGWSIMTVKEYEYIAQAKKQHISCDRCPFLHMILYLNIYNEYSLSIRYVLALKNLHCQRNLEQGGLNSAKLGSSWDWNLIQFICIKLKNEKYHWLDWLPPTTTCQWAQVTKTVNFLPPPLTNLSIQPIPSSFYQLPWYIPCPYSLN